MTGGSRIIAIGAGASSTGDTEISADSATAAEADAFTMESPEEIREDEDNLSPGSQGLLAPALAFLAIAMWSAFFFWANADQLAAGVTPREGGALFTQWSMPVLLICVVWLIAMRSSRRETARFGDAARLLSTESAQLEQRLVTVNQELSLAREFLAAQSRDLDALGRTAGERLSSHADRLQELVKDNGDQVEALASVSSAALDNMEKLRGHLPVIASSAKDVANHIGNAGRTAHTQLKDMVDGFNRLNEFGKASETHVENLREKIETSVEFLGHRLEDLRQRTENRLAEIQDQAQNLRTQMDEEETTALAGLRQRAATLQTELSTTREEMEEHETESLTSLRARLGALRDESAALARAMRDAESSHFDAIAKAQSEAEMALAGLNAKLDGMRRKAEDAASARLSALDANLAEWDARTQERIRTFAEEAGRRAETAEEAHARQGAQMAESIAMIDAQLEESRKAHEARHHSMASAVEAMSGRLEEVAKRMSAIAVEADNAQDRMHFGLQSLGEHLSGGRTALHEAAKAVAQLTDDSVRLLELLQASTQQSETDLPKAIGAGIERLGETEQRVRELAESLDALAQRSGDLNATIDQTRNSLAGSLAELESRHNGLSQGATRHKALLDNLGAALDGLDHESQRIAETARNNLATALEQLAEATKCASAEMESTGTRTVTALADRLGEESAAAVDRVLRARTAEAIGALEEAASHAAGVSRESALNLRDQLAKIDELTGNLERRVAQARERAEDLVNDDFARRVALITESLNSNAIDIAKALSSDVTDTAWAAYLRGDRGVFTRRAVRLLDNQEARSISRIYGEDPEFREQVSRYIHDFEGMLRQLLSTRDGHALSVTLLSSDMGKLYVALAQAIERLRA